MYTIDYFINKFEAIPENKWCTNTFDNGVSKCALGHCMDRNHTNFSISQKLYGTIYGEEFAAIVKLFEKEGENGNFTIAHINDGSYNKYKQSSPKQRILAALHDLKATRQAPPLVEIPEPKVRETIRYVSVPTTLTEQTKELIMQ